MRQIKLLVSVRGLSGRTYPAGTIARTGSLGEVIDAFVRGDWLPLSWWEFAECGENHLPPEPAQPA